MRKHVNNPASSMVAATHINTTLLKLVYFSESATKETAIPITQSDIDNLFMVGDRIACTNQTHLIVAAIQDQQLQLKTDGPADQTISITYATLSEVLQASPDAPSEISDSALHCFLVEYRDRAEQAKRDQEVDDMWKSAIVCQIQ